MRKKVLVLGGYGNFGKRIVEGLMCRDDIELVIAGRSQQKAEKLRCALQAHATAVLSTYVIDIHNADFMQQFAQVAPFVTIHTSGPFQHQQDHVVQACLRFGSHYIDLADGRRYVCDISRFNAQAVAAKVQVISGASTVPGVSSAVVAHFLNCFDALHTVDMAIVPGNKAERGEATVQGILSYTGAPFNMWINRQWEKVYGWMSLRKVDFKGNVGRRWLANVDVPDLELFPVVFPSVKTVTFQAGLELPILHLTMALMAFIRKYVTWFNWSFFIKPIMRISHVFSAFGTDKGAMRIHMQGVKQNQPCTVEWLLYAPDAVGPYIPTVSALLLANKILDGQIEVGARPCICQFTLDEFYNWIQPKGVYWQVSKA